MSNCTPLVDPEGKTVGHICRTKGTTKVIDRKVKWCFGCRKRVKYKLVVFVPEPYSYYGPSTSWECPLCEEDRTLFPGYEYEPSDY